MPEPGETVDAVRAEGKHLLVDFSGGLTLRTHLRMTGRWDLYRTDERWRRASSSARVVIEVPEWVAVCFTAPDVALSRRTRVATTHLRPDLCVPNPDFTRVAIRAAAHSLDGTTIAELLLDQRVAAGIGNVYRSEVLWLCEIDPFAPIEDVTPRARRALLDTAHQQLRHNLGPGPRRTVRSGLAVYERTGLPCLRCGTHIQMRRSGELGRSTWWCPACQRA